MSCSTVLKLAFANCTPVIPPVANSAINPRAHSIGGFNDTLPLHNVLNHENTFIPVGIATAIVAVTKYF